MLNGFLGEHGQAPNTDATERLAQLRDALRLLAQATVTSNAKEDLPARDVHPSSVVSRPNRRDPCAGVTGL